MGDTLLIIDRNSRITH